jgi:hypothetical protein
VLVAVGLVAMLAIAGLALDSSHSLTNKTRLQSATDAAALAAAKVYDQTADITAGNAAAMSVFGLNADGAGNQELDQAFDANEITIVIQWSESLVPFVSTGIGPYVRVIASGFQLDTTLSAVLGVTDIDIVASAVAGPSPAIETACNIAPLVACALDPADTDLFGFTVNKLEVLKSAAGDGSEIGPGNFQLLRLDCPGGACVRENLAGSYDGCVDEGDTVETEPGNTVGPTVQGLNTRLGDYSGPISPGDYPPDVVTHEPATPLEYDDAANTVTQNGSVVTSESVDYAYDDYQLDVGNKAYTHPPPIGEYERRILVIPIASCDGALSGQGTLDVVGYGCYYLMQRVAQQGNEAQIFGQFIGGCTANGLPGPDPDGGPDPYVIQLYKDPDSEDS